MGVEGRDEEREKCKSSPSRSCIVDLDSRWHSGSMRSRTLCSTCKVNQRGTAENGLATLEKSSIDAGPTRTTPEQQKESNHVVAVRRDLATLFPAIIVQERNVHPMDPTRAEESSKSIVARGQDVVRRTEQDDSTTASMTRKTSTQSRSKMHQTQQRRSSVKFVCFLLCLETTASWLHAYKNATPVLEMSVLWVANTNSTSVRRQSLLPLEKNALEER